MRVGSFGLRARRSCLVTVAGMLIGMFRMLIGMFRMLIPRGGMCAGAFCMRIVVMAGMLVRVRLSRMPRAGSPVSYKRRCRSRRFFSRCDV